jgi:hypothetical protein
VFNYIAEIINRYNREETHDESSSTPAGTWKGERHVRGPKILTEGRGGGGEEEDYGDGGSEQYGDCDYGDDNDDDDDDDDDNNNNNNNNNCDLYAC